MGDDEKEFGLIRPFGIDGGELDGLTPQECFTIGYELALFDERLKTDSEFTMLLHPANRDRVASACDKANRRHRLTWMPGDASENWMSLAVASDHHEA